MRMEGSEEGNKQSLLNWIKHPEAANYFYISHYIRYLTGVTVLDR